MIVHAKRLLRGGSWRYQDWIWAWLCIVGVLFEVVSGDIEMGFGDDCAYQAFAARQRFATSRWVLGMIIHCWRSQWI
jgi:hypothetical protein